MTDASRRIDRGESTHDATPPVDDDGSLSSGGGPPAGDGESQRVIAYLRRRAAWVRETARRDLAALDALPGGHRSVFVAVGVVVALFSFLRLGIADLYTESLPFLVLAVVLGTLGWTPGVALVLAHAVVDLLVSLGDLSLATFVGRGVSYVVLYALVVSIPATQRAVHARLDRLDRQYPWLDPVAAPASAVWAGALVYLWAEVAPYLVRAAFERSPNVAAVATVQDNVLLLTVVAVLAAAATAVGYQRRVGILVTLPWPADERLVPGRFRWLRRLFRYGVVVALVSGILTSALDLVVLAVALFAADLAVPRVARNAPLKRALLAIPYTVRLGLAFVLTYLAARAVMTIRYAPLAGSEFFPLVTSLAVGLFVFRVLLNVDETDAESPDSQNDRDDTDEESGGAGSTAVVLVALVAVALATIPDPVLAHDCSGLADCENGARAGTAAGVSALALALWYWTSGTGGSSGTGGTGVTSGASGTGGTGGTDGTGASSGADENNGTGESPGTHDATSGPDTERAALGETTAMDTEAAGIGEAPHEAPAERADDTDEEDDTDAAGALEIVAVVPGETPATEYVLLRNVGDGHLDLSEWTVVDDGGHEYRVPRGVVLEPGTRLQLYTGRGTDTESVRHWGLTETLWSDADARVTVRNAVGDVVDTQDVQDADTD